MAIYILEAATKITFFGKEYFDFGWNIFDFGATIGIIFFLIINSIFEINSAPLTVFYTLFRVCKLLSLFRFLISLRKIFQTFILALPSMTNLGVLLIIVNYIFAVIGVTLFAEVKLEKDMEEHANYENLLNSLLTVYRIATGDNWAVIMHDMMRQKTQYHDCINYPTYEDIMANEGKTNGCGTDYAALYCILLVIVINFIFINLFVAIVVASILEIGELSESVLSDETLDKFQHTWCKYDPDVTFFFNL